MNDEISAQYIFVPFSYFFSQSSLETINLSGIRSNLTTVMVYFTLIPYISVLSTLSIIYPVHRFPNTKHINNLARTENLSDESPMNLN